MGPHLTMNRLLRVAIRIPVLPLAESVQTAQVAPFSGFAFSDASEVVCCFLPVLFMSYSWFIQGFLPGGWILPVPVQLTQALSAGNKRPTVVGPGKHL